MSSGLTYSLAMICVGLLAGLGEATKRSFDGFSVVRSLPQTFEQLEQLRDLMDKSESAAHEGQLDFWTRPSVLNGSVQIMASPERLLELKEKLSRWNIPNELVISDLGSRIRSVKTGIDLGGLTRMHLNSNETIRAQLAASNYYSRFQRYSAIEAKLYELASIDERIKIEVIGKSSENRNLYLVKVSEDHAANKPVVLIDAGHHAREWISHSTMMYLIESLVNIDLPKMTPRACQSQMCLKPRLDLKKFDFWFIPVVNPDGYEYTHTTNRMWRKTRSSGLVGACRGTDPNRNYPFHWRESGASSFACSEIYAGARPSSEPELIMSPYGHQRVYPHNYQELEKSARKFIKSLALLRGTEYQFGVTSIILYPASGASDDYAHGSAGIRYTYTIELPDSRGENGGFVLPASEIIPVAHETLIGLQALIESMEA